jgi:hypothetical protein
VFLSERLYFGLVAMDTPNRHLGGGFVLRFPGWPLASLVMDRKAALCFNVPNHSKVPSDLERVNNVSSNKNRLKTFGEVNFIHTRALTEIMQR